jgi:hypothetical protein
LVDGILNTLKTEMISRVFPSTAVVDGNTSGFFYYFGLEVEIPSATVVDGIPTLSDVEIISRVSVDDRRRREYPQNYLDV